MSRPIITLTTDFGEGSPYVAAMKGVILSINPEATIVDITHSIAPQNVSQGALTLADLTPRFPSGSIHVAVIDPGVGSDREIVYAQFAEHHFVAPDNGLFDRLAAKQSPDRIIALTNSEFWLSEVSSTFHGRDIMAPVAAHLSLGLDPQQLGDSRSGIKRLPWPEVQIVPGKITGSVESIDSFGNLITDISKEMLAEAPRNDSVLIKCDDHETFGIFEKYADQPPMTLIALIGSSGKLELAIVDDSAKIMLGVREGTPVMVSW